MAKLTVISQITNLWSYQGMNHIVFNASTACPAGKERDWKKEDSFS